MTSTESSSNIANLLTVRVLNNKICIIKGLFAFNFTECTHRNIFNLKIEECLLFPRVVCIDAKCLSLRQKSNFCVRKFIVLTAL